MSCCAALDALMAKIHNKKIAKPGRQFTQRRIQKFARFKQGTKKHKTRISLKASRQTPSKKNVSNLKSLAKGSPSGRILAYVLPWDSHIF